MSEPFCHPYDGNPDPDRARWHEEQGIHQEMEENRWCNTNPSPDLPPLRPCTRLCQECRETPATKRHTYKVRAQDGSSFPACLDLCETCTPDRIFALPRESTIEPGVVGKLRGLWDPCFVCAIEEAGATWHGVHSTLKPRDFRLCEGCSDSNAMQSQRWAKNWTFTVKYDG